MPRPSVVTRPLLIRPLAVILVSGICASASFAATRRHAHARPAAAPAATPAAEPAPAALLPGGVPAAPQVEARSYILADFRTDKVLASLQPDARMDPASLTKLMTVYLVFQQLASGKLKLDDMLPVSEHAWRAGGAGTDGSSSFLELGVPVAVKDLLLGVIVQSGNDASIVLAERVGGTEETFAQLMNATAKQLGMTGSHFQNSTGLPSPQHYTTARDMSLLAIAIIRDFPQYYHWFSVREFEHNHIKQGNRNGLLDKDPTVDGLKTGHTDAAGFCLVSSAMRNGMRLVSVVLASNSMRGRENASAALLNYGFTFYDTVLVAKGNTALAKARLWKAAQPGVDLGVANDVYVTLPRGQTDIKTSTDIQPRIIAPVTKDSALGTLHVTAAGHALTDLALHPLQSVPAGGWWRRLIDTIRLWFA